MDFRHECRRRGWTCTDGRPPTHFLLDGGKLSVPDEHAGTFLNIYFRSVAVKRERLCVVELKTPVFRLFFDLDIRFSKAADTEAVTKTIDHLCVSIHRFVTEGFFDIHQKNSQQALDTVSDISYVCQAPTKDENDGIKYGVHLIFPGIYVNSPIALKARETLLEAIPDAFDDTFTMPKNSWEDVIDDSVYRANGLRMLYSHKGRVENRAYVPTGVIENTAIRQIKPSVSEARDILHSCSLRMCTATLTPCHGGEHEIADTEDTHRVDGLVIGKCVSIAPYLDATESLRQHLPDVYKNVSFVGAFQTDHAVMLKTNSRYCYNIQREHRTSTVYLVVTKHGVSQRCYCRKDEYGCRQYHGPDTPLPVSVVREFLPRAETKFLDDIELQARTSTKRRKSSLQNILKRSTLIKR